MKRTKQQKPKLSTQMKRRAANSKPIEMKEYEGSDQVVSTGSTLLDLAISGEVPGGGIPVEFSFEIFYLSGRENK